MNANVKNLLNQIRKVIELLNQHIENGPDKPIIHTLYDRYTKAENILFKNENIDNIMIKGGCRAYLDAFSDYMNPLLIEMDKAERLLLELKK